VSADVERFDRRAESYDRGPLGRWHRLVSERAAGLALAAAPDARRVLDVGCGTGVLLGLLAQRLPAATLLAGVDPAPGMVERSRARLAGERRVRVEEASAEALAFAAGELDLVVSVLSFDHWSDQERGLAECARVLAPAGRLLLVDLFAGWLALVQRRRPARAPRRAEALLAGAGLRHVGWSDVYRLGPLPLVRAAVARR
jgi:ubiquinone/menaquinone biosynthesis C-methylase UbiE